MMQALCRTVPFRLPRSYELSSQLWLGARKLPTPSIHRRFSSIAAPQSTMPTSDDPEDGTPFQYQFIEDVEKLYCYRPGGYHPVYIGDRLHSRYRIVHKLGYGSYSTVWLARDEQLKRYVAIKVGVADSDTRETDILSTLANSPRLVHEIPGRTMIPPVLDTFKVEGPNGTHPCFVTTPARASLRDCKDTFIRLFQLDVARALAAQLAIAVAYLHAKGFVHGDLHLGNILLKLPPDFDKLSEEELYQKYGAPCPEPVIHHQGKPLPRGVPSDAIAPAWLGELGEKLRPIDANIILADFGEAFSPKRELRTYSNTPAHIRPPEARFEPTRPLSFSSDIWTLACSIWDIVGQRSLFDSFLTTEDDVAHDQVKLLGILPPAWWEKWEAREKWFTEAGQLLADRPVWGWEEWFNFCVQEPRHRNKMEAFDPEERDALFAMLQPMLSFRPEDRPTAKQVLESAWMVKWALPEYEKILKQ